VRERKLKTEVHAHDGRSDKHAASPLQLRVDIFEEKVEMTGTNAHQIDHSVVV
jgi:hypothetical protein